MRHRHPCLLALSALLAGCSTATAVPTPSEPAGGPVAAEAPAEPRPDDAPDAPDPAARELTVVLTDFAFYPDPLVIPSGPVTLHLVNEGAAPHELAVTGQHSSGGHSHDVESGELVAGEAMTLEVDLAPGEYEVACHVQGHYELGMVAPLTVTG